MKLKMMVKDGNKSWGELSKLNRSQEIGTFQLVWLNWEVFLISPVYIGYNDFFFMSIVLTEIYPNFAKPSIQIVGPENIQHNTNKSVLGKQRSIRLGREWHLGQGGVRGTQTYLGSCTSASKFFDSEHSCSLSLFGRMQLRWKSASFATDAWEQITDVCINPM